MSHAPSPRHPDDDPEATFRDRVSTIDDQGGRNWIYPKKPSGRFYRWRSALSWLLLGFLFLSPFVTVNGHQLVLLNVLERKFVLFGVVFWPQDFYLFVLMMIATVVFIFLFTAVYGRVFCGWICPQTIFMEMVFRKIEYLIEGDAQAQRTLASAPWTPSKVFKKTVKQVIFFGLSFLIGNVFLAYIIGRDELLKLVAAPPLDHMGGFLAMLIFSGTFYFVFAWFREQACTLVCPYGRLQSVLLDENSVVISYDFTRGEPRGKYRMGESREGHGDCVECRQCVVVCPTGIDIRNGTQLECVNCTACIDACDDVMTRLHMPTGLIRYASYNSIATGVRRVLTPRVIGYTAVLTVILGVLVGLFVARTEFEATILRAPGTLYAMTGDDEVSNLYTIKVVNKTNAPLTARLALLSPGDGKITMLSGSLTARPNSLAQATFSVELEREDIIGGVVALRIGVYDGHRLIKTVASSFMGPAH
jgi:cytochrome c oxidase accessory protein FixG